LQRAAQTGKSSQAGAAKKLLRHGIVPLEKAVSYVCNQKGPGNRSTAVKYCQLVGPDVAAYLTLRVVLNNLAGYSKDGKWRPNSVVRVAGEIADAILDELRVRALKKKAPGLFRWVKRHLNTQNYSHRSRVFRAAYRNQDSTRSRLLRNYSDNRARVLLGTKLIDLLIHSTDLVRKQSRRSYRGGRWTTDVFLEPTENTVEWLRQANARLEWLLPARLPLVVPPLDWGPDQRGGYHFSLRDRYPLVRASREVLRSVEGADMPEVYAALNAIQQTAWRINGPVLRLVHEIVDRGSSLGSVPAFEKEPLPPRPADINSNEITRREWRKRAHEVHERNYERRCKAVGLIPTLSVADRMMEFARIYFAWNLDFRGRLYPIADYPTPHGDDLARALLTFAAGKPLGESGVRRLAIHGANMLAVDPSTGRQLDKLPFEERIQWVEQHTEEIVAVADDPWSNRWWEHAANPLQFYAFCLEWSGYVKQGIDYVCSLPVAMDGSCNGFQHFAALLRDPDLAREVNLLPGRRPRDLYEIVASRVHDVLVDAALDTTNEEASSLASLWLRSDLITRELVKGPTMTFSYSSRQYGFANQLQAALSANQRLAFKVEDDDHTARACRYLANVLWEVLQDTLASAFKTMEWLRSTAKIAVKSSGKPLRWHSPTGFPVVQAYMKKRTRQIKTQLAGSVFKPRLPEETDEVDLRRQVNGVAPNLIHSLDAAALVKTVNLAYAGGVKSFLMIHDSYATVPADADSLAGATRQAFVEMHTEFDATQRFHEESCTQYKGEDEPPEPPAKGDLDLSVVINSEYFFS
jgi:DNA-directed RNA polymerase